MLGFEKGKRNAFRVVFEDGTYGWYKVRSYNFVNCQRVINSFKFVGNRHVLEEEKIQIWKL